MFCFESFGSAGGENALTFHRQRHGPPCGLHLLRTLRRPLLRMSGAFDPTGDSSRRQSFVTRISINALSLGMLGDSPAACTGGTRAERFLRSARELSKERS